MPIDLLHPDKPCGECGEPIDVEGGDGVTWIGDEPFHTECEELVTQLDAAVRVNAALGVKHDGE